MDAADAQEAEKQQVEDMIKEILRRENDFLVVCVDSAVDSSRFLTRMKLKEVRIQVPEALHSMYPCQHAAPLCTCCTTSL